MALGTTFGGETSLPEKPITKPSGYRIISTCHKNCF